MARLPRITAAELLRALRRDGWRPRNQTGSHLQLVQPMKLGRVTVARHASLILAPKTLLTTLRQASLTVEELEDLL